MIEDLGSVPSRGKGLFFLHNIHTSSGAHPTSAPMGTGVVSPGVDQQGYEADRSPPSSTKVKEIYLHFAIDLHGVVFT
jgi:hypothetical protein